MGQCVPHFARSQQDLRRFAAIGLLALVYFVLCRVSLVLIIPDNSLVTIWPGAGVLLTALLLYGRTHRWTILATFALANLAASLLGSRSLAVSGALIVPHLVEAIVGEILYRRLAGRSLRIDTLYRSSVLVFVVTPVSTTVGAVLAAVALHVAADRSFASTLGTYWFAVSLGLLSTAPVLLLSFATKRQRSSRMYYGEFAVFVVAILWLSSWVFSLETLQEVPILRRTYTLIALHTWAAFRLRAREAAVLPAITMFVAIWFTTHGCGVFALGHTSEVHQLLDAEIYLCTITVLSLFVSVIRTERETQQRRLVSALAARSEHERLEHMRSITDAVPACIAYFDSNCLCKFVNKYCGGMWGHCPDQILGRHIGDILDPEAYRSYKPFIADVLNGKTQEFEIRFHAPNGEARHGRVTLVPHFDRDRQQVGFYCLASDITEQQAVAEQLRQHQENQANISRLITMGELAGGLAHELNQPLSAINNYSRGALRRITDPHTDPNTLKEAFEYISHEACRASTIIDGLRRHFARHGIARTPVSLAELAQRAIALCAADIRRHGIVTSVVDAVDVPQVNVDAVQIEQVLINLVRNACDAMRDTPAPRMLRIDIEATCERKLMVGVCDRGSGFSEEAKKRMFETFYSTKPRGLGMGLSICRSIIESHGGNLQALRNADGGATFRFTLPTDATGEVS